ncbi:hypothetical protein HYALB_00011113 [Hymenoscyphus albidus]|uniref:Uncharacterized protein n=1 Tax=Hymenoscyphus albidus TaxID=595503 RepID=A0A9N9LKN2_9HELO|nr:hypothetical protein HYALB_00011113 [Hymenoscyphus albidus]
MSFGTPNTGDGIHGLPIDSLVDGAEYLGSEQPSNTVPLTGSQISAAGGLGGAATLEGSDNGQGPQIGAAGGPGGAAALEASNNRIGGAGALGGAASLADTNNPLSNSNSAPEIGVGGLLGGAASLEGLPVTNNPVSSTGSQIGGVGQVDGEGTGLGLAAGLGLGAVLGGGLTNPQEANNNQPAAGIGAAAGLGLGLGLGGGSSNSQPNSQPRTGTNDVIGEIVPLESGSNIPSGSAPSLNDAGVLGGGAPLSGLNGVNNAIGAAGGLGGGASLGGGSNGPSQWNSGLDVAGGLGGGAILSGVNTQNPRLPGNAFRKHPILWLGTGVGAEVSLPNLPIVGGLDASLGVGLGAVLGGSNGNDPPSNTGSTSTPIIGGGNGDCSSPRQNTGNGVLDGPNPNSVVTSGEDVVNSGLGAAAGLGLGLGLGGSGQPTTLPRLPLGGGSLPSNNENGGLDVLNPNNVIRSGEDVVNSGLGAAAGLGLGLGLGGSGESTSLPNTPLGGGSLPPNENGRLGVLNPNNIIGAGQNTVNSGLEAAAGLGLGQDVVNSGLDAAAGLGLGLNLGGSNRPITPPTTPSEGNTGIDTNAGVGIGGILGEITRPSSIPRTGLGSQPNTGIGAAAGLGLGLDLGGSEQPTSTPNTPSEGDTGIDTNAGLGLGGILGGIARPSSTPRTGLGSQGNTGLGVNAGVGVDTNLGGILNPPTGSNTGLDVNAGVGLDTNIGGIPSTLSGSDTGIDANAGLGIGGIIGGTTIPTSIPRTGLGSPGNTGLGVNAGVGVDANLGGTNKPSRSNAGLDVNAGVGIGVGLGTNIPDVLPGGIEHGFGIPRGDGRDNVTDPVGGNGIPPGGTNTRGNPGNGNGIPLGEVIDGIGAAIDPSGGGGTNNPTKSGTNVGNNPGTNTGTSTLSNPGSGNGIPPGGNSGQTNVPETSSVFDPGFGLPTNGNSPSSKISRTRTRNPRPATGTRSLRSSSTTTISDSEPPATSSFIDIEGVGSGIQGKRRLRPTTSLPESAIRSPTLTLSDSVPSATTSFSESQNVGGGVQGEPRLRSTSTASETRIPTILSPSSSTRTRRFRPSTATRRVRPSSSSTLSETDQPSTTSFSEIQNAGGGVQGTPLSGASTALPGFESSNSTPSPTATASFSEIDEIGDGVRGEPGETLSYETISTDEPPLTTSFDVIVNVDDGVRGEPRQRATFTTSPIVTTSSLDNQEPDTTSFSNIENVGEAVRGAPRVRFTVTDIPNTPSSSDDQTPTTTPFSEVQNVGGGVQGAPVSEEVKQRAPARPCKARAVYKEETIQSLPETTALPHGRQPPIIDDGSSEGEDEDMTGGGRPNRGDNGRVPPGSSTEEEETGEEEDEGTTILPPFDDSDDKDTDGGQFITNGGRPNRRDRMNNHDSTDGRQIIDSDENDGDVDGEQVITNGGRPNDDDDPRHYHDSAPGRQSIDTDVGGYEEDGDITGHGYPSDFHRPGNFYGPRPGSDTQDEDDKEEEDYHRNGNLTWYDHSSSPPYSAKPGVYYPPDDGAHVGDDGFDEPEGPSYQNPPLRPFERPDEIGESEVQEVGRQDESHLRPSPEFVGEDDGSRNPLFGESDFWDDENRVGQGQQRPHIYVNPYRGPESEGSHEASEEPDEAYGGLHGDENQELYDGSDRQSREFGHNSHSFEDDKSKNPPHYSFPSDLPFVESHEETDSEYRHGRYPSFENGEDESTHDYSYPSGLPFIDSPETESEHHYGHSHESSKGSSEYGHSGYDSEHGEGQTGSEFEHNHGWHQDEDSECHGEHCNGGKEHGEEDSDWGRPDHHKDEYCHDRKCEDDHENDGFEKPHDHEHGAWNHDSNGSHPPESDKVKHHPEHHEVHEYYTTILTTTYVDLCTCAEKSLEKFTHTTTIEVCDCEYPKNPPMTRIHNQVNKTEVFMFPKRHDIRIQLPNTSEEIDSIRMKELILLSTMRHAKMTVVRKKLLLPRSRTGSARFQNAIKKLRNRLRKKFVMESLAKKTRPVLEHQVKVAREKTAQKRESQPSTVREKIAKKDHQPHELRETYVMEITAKNNHKALPSQDRTAKGTSATVIVYHYIQSAKGTTANANPATHQRYCTSAKEKIASPNHPQTQHHHQRLQIRTRVYAGKLDAPIAPIPGLQTTKTHP